MIKQNKPNGLTTFVREVWPVDILFSLCYLEPHFFPHSVSVPLVPDLWPLYTEYVQQPGYQVWLSGLTPTACSLQHVQMSTTWFKEVRQIIGSL